MGIDVPDVQEENRYEIYIDKILQVLQHCGIHDISADDFEQVLLVKIPGTQPISYLMATKISQTKKQMLLSQRTSLRNYTSRVYMNGDLTKYDARIMKKALQDKKNGVLHSVWSFQGKIFGKDSDRGKPFCLSNRRKLFES